MKALLAVGVLAVGVLAVGVLAACGGGSGGGDGPAFEVEGAGEVVYRGARVTPPLPKPAFTLTDTDGEPFDILAETEGALTLVYLGYTHCPDICPTHMLDLAKTLQAMDPALAEGVRVLFITTDPDRDGPAEMRRWLDLWDNRFVGLIPDAETLAALLRSLGMAPIVKTDLGDGRYSVNHASYLIAYTPDDLGHIVYPWLEGGGLREIMAHDLPLLAAEGWQEPS